jgi:hypothetical protein
VSRCGRRPEPGGTRRPVPVMPLAIAASVSNAPAAWWGEGIRLPCPCLKSASLSGLRTKVLADGHQSECRPPDASRTRHRQGLCRRPPLRTATIADSHRDWRKNADVEGIRRVPGHGRDQLSAVEQKSVCEQTLVMPFWLRVCRRPVYGSAALVKVVPPPPAASTWTMLASPETAALRKHEANL